MNIDQWEYLKHFVLKEWIEDEKKRQFTWAVHKFVTGYLGRSRAVDKDYACSQYLNALKAYCKLHEMMPEKLIEEAYNDKKMHHPRDITYIAEQRMAAFRDHLIAKGSISHNTVGLYMRYVQSFFSYNDTKLSSRHFRAPQQRVAHTIPLLTKELAREAYENVETLRDKALIHLLWSSGLRIGDVLSLNRSNIQEMDEWGIIAITSHKRERFLITVMTPDCLETVNRYLKRREDDLDALFSMRRKTGGWKRLDYNCVNKLFYNLSAALEIKGKSPLHAHNFRRAFSRTLELAGVRHDIRKFMMGHARELDENYIRHYHPEQVLEAIKPHYHILRLTGVTEEAEVMLESVESLKNEVAKLKSTVKKLVDTHPEFQGWEPYEE